MFPYASGLKALKTVLIRCGTLEIAPVLGCIGSSTEDGAHPEGPELVIFTCAIGATAPQKLNHCHGHWMQENRNAVWFQPRRGLRLRGGWKHKAKWLKIDLRVKRERWAIASPYFSPPYPFHREKFPWKFHQSHLRKWVGRH